MPAAVAATMAASATALLWATRGPRPPVDRVAALVPALRSESLDYTVQASFFRVATTGRGPAVAGMRIGRGDLLELDLRLSRDAAVYVVNEDDQGGAFLLFPLADGDLRNPLRGGQSYTLPGPRQAEPIQWEIDSFGGRERFYVIVAPTADPVMQAAIDRLTPASDNPAPPLTARADPASGGLRGAGKLARGRVAPTAAQAPWRQLAQPLSQQAESARGLWVRELTLENPLPR
jgi:hypothetical protein